MQSFYTFWLKKHPHQLGQNCAFMHNCYSNHAYMHSYCSICISYFSIFFLSHPLFFSLSPLTLTVSPHSFVFSTDQNSEKHSQLSLSLISFLQLPQLPIATNLSPPQPLIATHHRSLISPSISDLSTDLIAFLYFWLFDQWVSG